MMMSGLLNNKPLNGVYPRYLHRRNQTYYRAPSYHQIEQHPVSHRWNHEEIDRHQVANNCATHKHPTLQEWFAKQPRFHMHFTPTSASRLNMVEPFFRDLTDTRLRRGMYTSVPELVAAVDAYIAHHDTNPKPFI